MLTTLLGEAPCYRLVTLPTKFGDASKRVFVTWLSTLSRSRHRARTITVDLRCNPNHEPSGAGPGPAGAAGYRRRPRLHPVPVLRRSDCRQEHLRHDPGIRER